MEGIEGRNTSNSDVVKNVFAAFANGSPIIIVDDCYKLEAVFAVPATACTREIVNLLLARGRGILCIALTEQRAMRLGICRQYGNRRDPRAAPYGPPVSLDDGSSCVSAAARSRTIRAIATMTAAPIDLIIPGHVQTRIAHPDLSRGRAGRTETVLELARFVGIEDVVVLCDILNDAGDTADREELMALSRELRMPLIDQQLILSLSQAESETENSKKDLNGRVHHRLWRHRGHAALAVSDRNAATWCLTDGRSLVDCSGGTLVQSLGELPSAPSGLNDLTAPTYGFDLPYQMDAEAALAQAAGDGLAGTIWTCSGTDAMEAAIRVAVWAAAQRGDPLEGFVTLRGSYHGASATCATLSSKNGPADPSRDWPVICLEISREDRLADVLERVDRTFGSNGAGRIFCLEGRSTAGWSFGWEPGFCVDLVRALKARGFIVIQDDIASGAFRHGGVFSTGADFEADVIILSKGLTQGRSPLAAVLLGEELDAALALPGAPHRGHTFGLTAPAAWYMAQSLERLALLLQDSWFDARARMLADSRARLSAEALHLDVTPTSLRVACQGDRLPGVRESLRAEGLWCYSTETRCGTAHFGFIHVCPLFDQPAEVQAAQFDMVTAALTRGLRR